MSEEVLCIKREKFEELVGHSIGGEKFYPCDVVKTMRWNVDGDSIGFVSRGKCETDPEWLQIIPYVIVSSDGHKKRKILTYSRCKEGSEERLHGKSSIGFGGHINRRDNPKILDTDEQIFNVLDYIVGCAYRELKEELNLDPWDFYLGSLGWIFEDTNEVGKVHVGAVLVADIVTDATVTPESGEISNLRFVGTELAFSKEEEKDTSSFELWSSILLNSDIYVNNEFAMMGLVESTKAEFSKSEVEVK